MIIRNSNFIIIIMNLIHIHETPVNVNLTFYAQGSTVVPINSLQKTYFSFSVRSHTLYYYTGLTKFFKTDVTSKMQPLHFVDIPSEKATFAMGCFWAPDSLFGATPGIITTRVGYSGGSKDFVPTYKNIGDYTEAIQLQYDPTTVSYLELLKLFWDYHDPTAKFKKQYSSFIYYHNDQQKTEAEITLNEKKTKGLDILTKIEPAGEFFNAEDYHQKYRLQQHKNLCKDLGLNTGDDLIHSHVAARLNGYVVGQGGVDQFNAEATKLKLDEAAIEYIRKLVIKYEGQGLHC